MQDPGFRGKAAAEVAASFSWAQCPPEGGLYIPNRGGTMKIDQFGWADGDITIDIVGENGGEKALLRHLQEGHTAFLCPGNLGNSGARVFVRNTPNFQVEAEHEDSLGRRHKLGRRKGDRKTR